MIRNSEIPGFFSHDAAVQEFCETELWDFSPYKVPMSARDLFEAARVQFGDMQCWDLHFWTH